MLFIVTDNYRRAAFTGESAILCLVEGPESPADLLKKYHERVRAEEQREHEHRIAFPEKYPTRPKAPWWKWWKSTETTWQEWQNILTAFYERLSQYCDSYQPQDKIPELDEYLREHGYRLVEHQIV